MSKGIIYVMRTCVDGLVKIGKTGIDNYEQRMSQLENNGYRRIAVLTREFAIEVEDYDAKEKLLHELFSKSRVGNSELFSLDIDLVKQLMSSFEGNVIYPKGEKKDEIFEQATEVVEVKKGIIPDGIYTLKIKVKECIYQYAEAKLSVEGGVLFIETGAKLAPLGKISVKGWIAKRESTKIEKFITQERIECDSPSMAAAIVVGHNFNGWRAWKNERGEYIDVYREKLDENESENCP